MDREVLIVNEQPPDVDEPIDQPGLQEESERHDQHDDGDQDLRITDGSATKGDGNKKQSFVMHKLYCYCKFITKYPIAAFLLTLTCQVVVIVTTGTLHHVGYNIFPVYFKNIPMELYDVPYKRRSDAWAGRKSYDNINYLILWNEYYERSYAFRYLGFYLFYNTANGNIFTKSNLKKIFEIETDVLNTRGYDQFCVATDRSLKCRKPKSILRFFDGTHAKYSPLFNNNTNFENISAVLYEAYRNNKTKDEFEYILPKTFSLSPTSSHASMIRSEFEMSVPHPNGNETWHVTESRARHFLNDEVKSKLWTYVDSISQFKFSFFCMEMMFDDLEKQTYKDLYFAIGSLCFIFLFMLFHTRSLWITCWAIFSILTSYLGTNIIYRCIIGYQYFGYFQVMVIFIILGIGADDLFVFYDTWRLTSHSEYTSLAHRLFDCFSKSMTSMFITSLTTAVSFFMSAISPLLATRSFGIFSGILVLYNYISVFIFFPTVVAVYHIKLKSCSWCCLPSYLLKHLRIRTRNTNRYSDLTYLIEDNIESRENRLEGTDIAASDTRNNDSDHVWATEPQGNHETGANHSEKKDKLVVFFKDYYFHFISDTYVRWAFLVLFFTIVLFFSYQATRLEPDNNQLQIFKNSHNYAKALALKRTECLQEDPLNYISVYIVWGLLENDRSTCNFTSLECTGQEVFDDHYNPNTQHNQLALKKFCDELLNVTEDEIRRLRIRRHSRTKDIEVACFTHNLEAFIDEKKRQVGLHDVDLGLPWDYNKTDSFMRALPVFYPVRYNASFKYYLDIPVQFWMLNGNTMKSSKDHNMFFELIGEQRTGFSQELLHSKYFYYGNKLKYLAVQVNTTINMYETSFAEGIPVIERWEEYVNNKMSKMPVGLKNGFQLTEFEWHWLYVQRSLATNAILSLTFGILLSFPIITLLTKNIIIGFCATLSICLTTVCVVGVIPFAGWKLGVLVSLNLCLVVGMSVDYVVHLAEGYHLSPNKDRMSRTRDMLEAMGSPVVSGAFTTLGASAFMFFAQIQFAFQFGVFIFCNIGFSLLFSLGFFTTFMGIFGPENDSGSLRKILPFCCSCCRNIRKFFK